MMMGTADPLPTGPSKPVIFEEDLTTEQKTQLTVNADVFLYPASVRTQFF